MIRQKKLLITLLFLIIIILIKLKQKRRTKHKRWANRKWYIRPINQNRLQQGEYHTLFKELKESEDKYMFFEYSRMSMLQFNKLLYFVQSRLVKRHKRALSPEERLIIALRAGQSTIRNSDGGIFDASVINKTLQNGQLNLPKNNAKLPGSDISLPGFFIGNSAFPLTTRMMKPYYSSRLTYAQRIYNYRHSRARRTIESSFGILANRWQVFHKSICMLPQTVDKIIVASVCLHNFLMYQEQKDGAKVYSQEIDDNNIYWSPAIVNTEQNDTQMAITQRDNLCEYFVSSVGEVDFQYYYINRGIYRE